MITRAAPGAVLLPGTYGSMASTSIASRPWVYHPNLARLLMEGQKHAAEALAEMVESCLASGKLFRREEIETSADSGESKRLGATVAPIDPANESGPRGALCLLTDITEVMRLREEVALKRNLESLGEMSAGLAHEFKNATIKSSR